MTHTTIITERLRAIADVLREHPGRWAQYPGRATNLSASLYQLERGNYAKSPSFPPEEFEFRIAPTGDEIHVRCRIHTDG